MSDKKETKKKKKKAVPEGFKPKKNSELTDQQILFVERFIETGNKAQSYMDAGYKSKSVEAASAGACRLLKKDKVLEYYESRMKELKSKQIASADEVLLFLSQSMRGEIKDAFDLDAALADRLRAAELLGKRFKLFTDKTEVSGTVPVVISGEDDLVD